MERLSKCLIILTFYVFCCFHGQAQKAPEKSRWSKWSDWSLCTKSCVGGVQTRIRTWQYAPNDPNRSKGTFTYTELMECNTGTACQVNGSWTAWTIWEECGVGCGGGKRTRRRECANPPPQHNGSDCKGEPSEESSCNEDPCPLTPLNFNMSVCNKGSTFTCENKQMCVPLRQWCDGTAHCSDGSDEVGCRRRSGYKIGRVHFSNASSQHTASCIKALGAVLVSFWFIKLFIGGQRHSVDQSTVRA